MLIAPLDWGLGHASRCIPIIKKLLQAGFKVIIAADGDQKILLQTAFPALEILKLKGYKMRYGSTKKMTIVKIISQIPKMLTAINKEHSWLGDYIKRKHLDIVISDNRFGLYHSTTINIFITHQLRIKAPFGNKAAGWLQKINYAFINRFNCCWVPDLPGNVNLAGELSHPAMMPGCPVIYTGLLSAIKEQSAAIRNKLLVILSGPEPQRTLFENELAAQLKRFSLPAVFVRGLPAATTTIAISPGVTVHDYLPAGRLQEIINESAIIICRSGYSTVMDLLPLGKKCIFIPTPGQTEQEYLASYLAANNYACTASQEAFNLPAIIAEAEKKQLTRFNGGNGEGLDHAIEELKILVNTRRNKT